MTTLTILLGAGGVGKTTLAAAHALSLARRGRRVGLLGIDPSRRLQTALGVVLTDREVELPGAPGLRAAILAPGECLRRWAGETTDARARERLLANPFFLALADRLAAATDVLAAVRIAEWLERDRSLTDLVVDTAPGLHAIDFLRRPRALAAFLEGDLVRWLRRAAKGGMFASALMTSALSKIGGGPLLGELAEFLALIEEPVARMLERVAAARERIEHDAQLLLVTTIREDAAATATAIADALRAMGLAPTATLVNRALPATVEHELGRIDAGSLSGSDVALLRYARAYAATQASVVHSVRGLAPTCIMVPLVAHGDTGLAAIAAALVYGAAR